MQWGKCGSFVHILILFYWLCIWLGHWGGHGHRSSAVRRRLQSQDVDCLDNTGANKRMIEGVCWGSCRRSRREGCGRRGGEREQVAGARLDFLCTVLSFHADDDCLRKTDLEANRGHWRAGVFWGVDWVGASSAKAVRRRCKARL
jgi:hypothetical protein